MPYNNEELAIIILEYARGVGNDKPVRDWIFNYYCTRCARFLYIEDFTNSKCRKCGAPTKDAIGHAIPFLVSATALEKLIVWIRSNKLLANCIPLILSEFDTWINGRSSTIQYHQAVIDIVGGFLETKVFDA